MARNSSKRNLDKIEFSKRKECLRYGCRNKCNEGETYSLPVTLFDPEEKKFGNKTITYVICHLCAKEYKEELKELSDIFLWNFIHKMDKYFERSLIKREI